MGSGWLTAFLGVVEDAENLPQEARRHSADRVDRNAGIVNRALHTKARGEQPAAFFRAEQLANQRESPEHGVEEVGWDDRAADRGARRGQSDRALRSEPE